jgi:hypothetical protein
MFTITKDGMDSIRRFPTEVGIRIFSGEFEDKVSIRFYALGGGHPVPCIVLNGGGRPQVLSRQTFDDRHLTTDWPLLRQTLNG